LPDEDELMVKKDKNISAMSTPAIGEAGLTGDWRDRKPVIDHSKCIPSVKNRPACYLCWLYCPEGVIVTGIPVKIDMDYCKGCGICAEECPAKAITMVNEGDDNG
jgi:pyruvate ferredoxin oxidoreductase delta subunit